MNANKKSTVRLVCLLIIVSVLLTSCGRNQKDSSSNAVPLNQSTPTATVLQLVETISPTEMPILKEDVSPTYMPTAKPVLDGLSDEQRNSIGMLNF
ncbi:MAG: hypothetical protein II697_04030, partial [Clostridia bacterium]|nr:hypothetical protein [Clostridia bacterium]